MYSFFFFFLNSFSFFFHPPISFIPIILVFYIHLLFLFFARLFLICFVIVKWERECTFLFVCCRRRILFKQLMCCFSMCVSVCFVPFIFFHLICHSGTLINFVRSIHCMCVFSTYCRAAQTGYDSIEKLFCLNLQTQPKILLLFHSLPIYKFTSNFFLFEMNVCVCVCVFLCMNFFLYIYLYTL